MRTRAFGRRCIGASMALVSVFATAPAAAADEPTWPASSGADLTAATIPGRIVVTWQPTTSPEARHAVRQRHGLTTLDTVAAIDLELVAVPTDRVPEIASALERDAAVASAAPELLLTTASDDPYFDDQWGLHNTGQDGGVADVDIDAVEAWDLTRGSDDVVVAVIDTGIQLDHPDLAGRIWVNDDEVPGNGVDDDGNGYVDDVNGWDFLDDDNDPSSTDGHGTHVAGTIAAVADNQLGVAGVAPMVRIMPLRFMGGSPATGSSFDAAAAVTYAAANGARVANASWGGGGGDDLRVAIRSAPDVAFVAAAGNTTTDTDVSPFYPAAWARDTHSMPTVLSVASVTRTGLLSSTSNYGAASIDVGAPGVSITSTWVSSEYAIRSGTSMAAPHAAGVAALVASVRPAATGAGLVDAVKAAVQPLAALDGRTTTGGLVNAHAAVVPHVPPGAPTGVTATAGEAAATVSWAAPTTGGTPASYAVTVSPTSGVTGGSTRSVAAPATSLGFTGLTNGTAYTFTVVATNPAGSSAPSAASDPVTPTAPPPPPPPPPPPSGGGGGSAPAPAEAPGTVSGDVDAGGSVTTDTDGTGGTLEAPLQTTVTSPVAGRVAITTGASTWSPTDWSPLGVEVVITAPATTPTDPAVIRFDVDASLLPTGAVPFADGVPVPACQAPGVADPDPCVSERTVVGDDLRFTVLASAPSAVWRFARPTVACPEGAVGPHEFADVSGIHGASVACLAWWDVTSGTSATTYDPAAPVRRDQMASFVARALAGAGVDLPSGGDGFADVSGGAHAAAIESLAAAGIVTGTGADTYGPAGTVTRAQMASFLVRAAEFATDQPLPVGSGAFSDLGTSVHRDAIEAAHAAGLVNGTGPDSYAPVRPVTRAQMASFLVNLLDLLVARGLATPPV